MQGEEYCSWMAGCRMVMKGRALARAGYDQELSSIRAFVAMQNKADPGSSSAQAESVRVIILSWYSEGGYYLECICVG